MMNFYRLYQPYMEIGQQLVAQLQRDLFSIPWGHHIKIMDRCRDNPTIGLLVCKQKDTLPAKYALESTTQPLGISEYELAQLYPENIEGTIPTIEEIEANLEEKLLQRRNKEPV